MNSGHATEFTETSSSSSNDDDDHDDGENSKNMANFRCKSAFFFPPYCLFSASIDKFEMDEKSCKAFTPCQKNQDKQKAVNKIQRFISTLFW